MANAGPLLPGDPDRLGAYRLSGRLGQGGQGTVFLGCAPSGERVAVKLLHAEWTRDPVARARFAREVAAAGKVAPFCTAAIIDAQLDGDKPFVVSEFIDGPSLHAVVATDGPLAGSALDRLAVATATALSAIHQAGVVHRDFKPGNVLMGPDGVRVIDFGIARHGDATATLTSQVFGTPGYMAPEVVRGEPAGPPADVFAWAATIAFAATGQSPFHATNMAAIIHRVTQGEPDLAALTGHLRGLVADCLAKDAAARPTAVDLLMRLLRHVPPVSRPLQAAGVHAAGAGAAVIAAPEQDWRETQAPPPAPPWAAGPTVPHGGAGYRMPQPAPARRRPGGHPGAWVAAVIAGLALIAIGGLLVPRLIAGPSPAGTPAPRASAPPAQGRRTQAPRTSASHSPRAGKHQRGVPAHAIPARFAGTWTGSAVQVDGLVTRWSATLVLPEGATSGSFTIPAIPCSATATVTQVTLISVVLRERIKGNPSGRCAPSGTITLILTGAFRARMLWQDARDHANVATGVLTRG